MSTDAQWQWQAPPGWPPPPSGWSPPPGWAPDPSWPSPPPGWVWWRVVPGPEHRRGGAGRVLLYVAAGVACQVALGLPFVALLVALAFGGPVRMGVAGPPPMLGSFDLTNDTVQVVTVGNCAGPECMPAGTQDQVFAGQDATITTTNHGAGAGLTSWQVTTGQGVVLGFVVLTPGQAFGGVTVRVGALSHDRRTPTPIQAE